MAFDVQGALAAGHSPSAILDHLSQSGLTKFDIAGARAAGYGDQDILGEIAKGFAAPAQPDTTFGSAFQQGLAQPVENIGTTMRALGVPGGQTVEQAGKGMAPANYQPTQFDALTPSTWTQLPRAVTEQAGQLLGSLATRGAGAAVGGAVGGPVGAAVGAFAAPAAFAGAQVLGPIALERAQSQGRTEPNADDLRWAAATAAASGALDSLSLGAGKAATTVAGRVGRHALAEGITEGAQSGIEQAGATIATPGGIQVDPRRMLNEGVVGAATGGTVHAGTHAAGAATDSFRGLRDARRSGEALRAFQQEAAQASQASQQDPSAPPLSFDALSPLAQNGAAELAALEMYGQRRKTETTGMGREGTHDPADTFKGVLDDVERNLREVSGLLVRQGTIRPEDGKSLIDAIYEAKRHNRTTGEGGETVSYFDTNRDLVMKMPGLDQETRNTLLMQLRVLDVASENGLKRNAKGFLERHAGLAGTLTGAALGSALPVGPVSGAIIGHLSRAGSVAVARSLDRLTGTQLPPLLRKEDALKAFAAKHDLQPGTTAQDLMDLKARLQASQAQRDTADADLNARVAETAPEPVQGWTLGIAKELGFRTRDVEAAVQLLFPEQTAKDLLARNTIPEASMKRVTRMLRDIAEDGTLGPLGSPRPDATPTGTVQGHGTIPGQRQNPVVNPQAYQAAIDNALAAQQTVRDQHPDLAPLVDGISALKTKQERRAFLTANTAPMPQSQRLRALAVLGPLTAFGADQAAAGPQGASTGTAPRLTPKTATASMVLAMARAPSERPARLTGLLEMAKARAVASRRR